MFIIYVCVDHGRAVIVNPSVRPRYTYVGIYADLEHNGIYDVE